MVWNNTFDANYLDSKGNKIGWEKGYYDEKKVSKKQISHKSNNEKTSKTASKKNSVSVRNKSKINRNKSKINRKSLLSSIYFLLICLLTSLAIFMSSFFSSSIPVAKLIPNPITLSAIPATFTIFSVPIFNHPPNLIYFSFLYVFFQYFRSTGCSALQQTRVPMSYAEK